MSGLIPRKVKRGIVYKRCSKCKHYLPSTEFYPDRDRTPDYLQSYCKNCMHQYNTKRKLQSK